MNYEIFKDQLTANEIAGLKDFDRRYKKIRRQGRPRSPKQRAADQARSEAMKGQQADGLLRWMDRQQELKMLAPLVGPVARQLEVPRCN